MKSLLLGCGNRRNKLIFPNGNKEWDELVTLDWNPSVAPDIIHNLEVIPYPFESNTFDEVHAYEVMEHVGKQGDWIFFFRQMNEIWRILKPDGFFCSTNPMHTSVWAWCDPGHTRIFSFPMAVFLDREQYNSQQGNTAMTDYRDRLEGDFRRLYSAPLPDNADVSVMMLQAVKPPRPFTSEESCA